MSARVKRCVAWCSKNLLTACFISFYALDVPCVSSPRGMAGRFPESLSLRKPLAQKPRGATSASRKSREDRAEKQQRQINEGLPFRLCLLCSGRRSSTSQTKHGCSGWLFDHPRLRCRWRGRCGLARPQLSSRHAMLLPSADHSSPLLSVCQSCVAKIVSADMRKINRWRFRRRLCVRQACVPDRQARSSSCMKWRRWCGGIDSWRWLFYVRHRREIVRTNRPII